MVFQLLHYDFDGLIELRVMASTPCGGIEIYVHVGRNAMVLHFPIAVKTVDGGARSGDAPSVNQLGIASDADQAAPGSLANQRTDSSLAEIPRQRISTRAGHFVDDQNLRSVDRFRGTEPVMTFAGNDFAEQRPPQVVDD